MDLGYISFTQLSSGLQSSLNIINKFHGRQQSRSSRSRKDSNMFTTSSLVTNCGRWQSFQIPLKCWSDAGIT